MVEVFSKKFRVIGFDVSEARVAALKKEFQGNANLTFTNVISNEIEGAALYLISVPTLLKENGIDSSYVQKAAETVSKLVRPGSAVVMESSVTVGMTEEVIGGLRSKNIFVGFSPERVDPVSFNFRLSTDLFPIGTHRAKL